MSFLLPAIAYTLAQDFPVRRVTIGDIIIRDGLAFEVRDITWPTLPAVVVTFYCNILGAPHDAAPLYAGIDADFDMVARAEAL